MKKLNFKLLVIIIVISLIALTFISGCTSTQIVEDNVKRSQYNNMVEYKYDDVKDALIRFHVIANSDNEKDQSIKLIIKDKIINYIYPFLQESKSLENSRQILNDQKSNILDIATEVLSEYGYDYGAKIEFSKENIPEKSYGNVILPQGEYEAFRVILGNGEGKNWWCVMFPPMCFIDVTKGKIEEDKSREELDCAIEDKNKHSEEIEDKNKHDDEIDNNKEGEVKIKFKILEIFK